MGRIGRSWELISQSFAILNSDKELMLLPVASAIACVALSVVLLSGGTLLFLPQLRALGRLQPHQPIPMSQGMWAWLFLFYVLNYFVVIFFNVALVSIAENRLVGGKATMNDGLQTAWKRTGVIFEWAVLAATVGIVLRVLEDRMEWLGRFMMGLIGVAWTLASFFVVPILAAEDIGPVEALYRSAELFSQTWGEQVAGGFSFGLIFLLLALPGGLLPVLGVKLGPAGAAAGLGLAVIYWLLLSVVSSAAQGIFMAALYRYATTGEVSAGFTRDDLAGAWKPKDQ
ncbi:MAG TPA: DUF6159 family protein [Candidatus Acidoferrales bacterium]|nr:DUF6159 family protein [Candidatus Acidoferrales bacterium]